MSKQRAYNQYRRMFSEFIYESFDYDVQSDGLHIAFTFRLVPSKASLGSDDNFVFRPSAFFPARPFLNPAGLKPEVLDILVFNVGMAELVSYWKCFCPSVVTIRPFALEQGQIDFWKKLYFNGLGEFFYTNNISATIDDFMSLRTDSDNCSRPFTIKQQASANNTIIPIGGGKDSVVTLEFVEGIPLIMNPRGATVSCIEKAGFTTNDVIIIHRRLDPLMLDYNKKGALNGHTPFSAMLAFYTVLASAMTGNCCNIALSNESSANESTVVGTKVNHQYSKSLEFENDFRSYVANYITPDINYYSFLRPLSELQIAMLFSSLEKYHDVFRSCNVGSKEDIWCGHCAKCLFAYIILSPFIEPSKLEAIFGKNMLDDISLQHEFDQLTGNAETKPFECVGTVDEVNTALAMSIERWYTAWRPQLLEQYTPLKSTTSLDTLFNQHNVPEECLTRLRLVIENGFSISTAKKLQMLHTELSGKTILIAGYGREGQSTYRLLRTMFPNSEFDVAHNNDEIRTALSSRTYDLVFKSPGIPSMFFDNLCDMSCLTSQTDIFLRLFGEQTIAVTGTKGKSTTTSLIHKVLSDNFDGNVILAGNIGIPLFDIINQVDDGTLIVAELSCHQLENISHSPSVGVILNLFEEHLDHYRNYNDYCNAKLQMALHQTAGSILFYCHDNKDLRQAIAEHSSSINGSAVPYGLREAQSAAFLQGVNLPLAGDHNLCNVYVAWLVCNHFAVPSGAFMASLLSFRPLEHRMEYVGVVDEVTFVNDSISTIPQATIAAVEALKDVDTLILGGFNRGIDYYPLTNYLENSPLGKKVRNLILLGSAGKAISDSLSKCRQINVFSDFGEHYDLEEAIHRMLPSMKKHSTCLLSPAASSYDNYKNFEERGNHFKSIVKSLN